MDTKTNKSAFKYLRAPLHIDDDEILDKDIFAPYHFNTTSNPANKFKRSMLQLLGNWLKVPEDKIEIIDELIDYTFNATLMYDDMQDNTAMRRGKPAAHTVYGPARTILALNWGLKQLLGVLLKLDNQEVSQLISQAMPKLLGGQGLEIYRRRKNLCPTEAEYFQIVYLQASQAFLLVGNIMLVYSKAKKRDVETILTTCGIYYQILNDYRNLRDLDYLESRGNSNDLSEGHFGFPVIHAINNFPEEGKIIQDIMEKRLCDAKETQLCISILKKCGSFQYTEKKIEELKEIILKEVAKFDDGPEIKRLLENVILANTF